MAHPEISSRVRYREPRAEGREAPARGVTEPRRPDRRGGPEKLVAVLIQADRFAPDGAELAAPSEYMRVQARQ